jgi:hypothetical protein
MLYKEKAKKIIEPKTGKQAVEERDRRPSSVI